MKKITILGLLIVLCIAVTGCSDKESEFKLQITQSSWSGWSEDYEPQKITEEYDIVLGKEYDIDSSLVFKIEKINSDSIVIETKKPFSDKDVGIDLYSKKTKFEINFDKEIKLTTPTMDAGNIYYLKLVK